MSGKTRKTAELSVFTAVAFIFSYIESLFPLPIPFPGIKLGLANLIILVVLCRNGLGAAFGVSMTRNVLNALTFGSLFGLFYSLAGSILSLLFMAALLPGKDSPKKRVKKGWLKIAALQESLCDSCSVHGELSYKIKKMPSLSLVSISAVGGILHNIGQFFVAVILVGFSAILHYLPFLYFAGLIAGVLTGILAKLCLKRLP